MFKRWFKPQAQSTISTVLYDKVVAQSRCPDIFITYKIADKTRPRFYVLLLHTLILNRRLIRDHTESSDMLSQQIFDHFTDGLAIALREIGYSDTALYKRQKLMLGQYYALAKCFDAHMGNDEQAIVQTLQQRFAGRDMHPDQTDLTGFVHYICRAQIMLDQQDSLQLHQGKLTWPHVKTP